jgi:hypothetical protein
MTDREIDRLLRDASPLTDPAAAALDLGTAETDLLEEIMTLTDETSGDADQGTVTAPGAVVAAPRRADGPSPERRRPRAATLVAVAAAGFLVAVAIGSWRAADVGDGSDPDVATEPSPPPVDGELPRLLADPAPPLFQLSNTEVGYGQSEGAPDGFVVVEPTGPDDEAASYSAIYSLPMPGPNGVSWFTITSERSDEPLPAGEPVTVRGHEGRLAVRAADPATGGMVQVTVAWDEAPGVRATVDAINSELTEADVLAIAEGVRAAGEEEWEEATHLNDPADPATVEGEIPGDAQGRVTVEHLGGAVYTTADDRVCAFRVDRRGRFPDVCGARDGGPHLLKDRIGWPSVLFGVLPDGATQVVATRGGTDITAGPPGGPASPGTVIGGDGIYAVSVGPVRDTLTFLDDAGAAVDTVALDIEPDI